jgi:hypothetical protein
VRHLEALGHAVHIYPDAEEYIKILGTHYLILTKVETKVRRKRKIETLRMRKIIAGLMV